jgi:RNA exonuclease 1
MLDDISQPEWIEVRNKSCVRACVAVVVPGLSPQTFNIEPTHGSEGKKMRRLTDLDSTPLPNLAKIFKYMWLPKAPGTNTQLFSPVTSFLNVPLSASQNIHRAREQSKQKGMTFPRLKLMVGEHIDVETLLMNPVEMRNAGYPIHPLHEDGLPELDVVCTPSVTEDAGRRKTVIGIDCEMCKTEAGSEITRVTLVDFQGNTLYDELVKPENPIIDYLTTYSSSQTKN